MNVAAKCLSVEGEQKEFCAVFIAEGGGGNEDEILLSGGVGVVRGLGLELDGGVHFGAEVGIRLQNLNFHLDGGFLPVRLRRHLGDFAFVGAVFEGVEGDGAFLFRREFGEVVLSDVEFDLDVVQVGERNDGAARTAFGTAGELGGDEFTFFGGAIENRTADGGADDGGIELRFGVLHGAFGLEEIAFSPFYFFGAGAELHEAEGALERIHALLRGVVLGGGVVQILLGHDALIEKIAGASESDFVVLGGSAGFGEIVVGLLNFFGTGSVLLFEKAGFGALVGSASLFVLGAVFVVFEADEYLTFFYFVAFFDADPSDAAGDFGVHADFVVGDDVSAGGEDGAAGGVAAFGDGAGDFDFGSFGGEGAVGEGGDSEQDDDGDSAEDDAARPGGRFSATVAQRVVDAQAAEVVVLGIALFDV